MALRFKLFSPNTVLSADDMNDVANNGVVTIGSTADLDSPDLADVNVVYVQSETKLRVRKSAGLGIAHWSNPFDSTVPDYFATVTQTGYGVFTVTNYNPEFFYSATTTAGSVVVNDTGSACTITSSGTGATNSVITLHERTSEDGESKITYIERKAYTYTNQPYQSCSNNCGVVNGVNCFQGTGTCWCGTCAADGTICCGGCYGQTCTSVDNWVKNATPSGYTDSNGEWWKTWTA